MSKSQMFAMRMSAEMLEDLDRLASKLTESDGRVKPNGKFSRSDAARYAMEIGLRTLAEEEAETQWSH